MKSGAVSLKGRMKVGAVSLKGRFHPEHEDDLSNPHQIEAINGKKLTRVVFTIVVHMGGYIIIIMCRFPIILLFR